MRKLLLQEHRCKCGKLLLKGMVFDGSIEIKCKRCNKINQIGNLKFTTDDTHYLLLINEKGIIANASVSASSILGYTYEELIGKHFTQINPTMPREMGERFFGPKSGLNEENYLRIDTIHQSKDGKNIPITAYLKLYIPNDKERFVLLLAELQDVLRDRDSFKNSTPKFVDNACDFYFDIDVNGIGEYMSPSVERIFGFVPERVIGKNYFDYLPAETREEARKTFEHFSLNRQPFRVNHECGKNAFGKTTHNQLFFTPKFNDSGKFVGYRVLGWVILKPQSERSKVENSKKQKQRQKQKNPNA